MAARTQRQYRGAVAHQSGVAAEHIVAHDYQRRGFAETRRRWRGAGGEIDLILHKDGHVVFVEVKSARTHALAAERLSAQQLRRIETSGAAYLAGLPKGSLTECRIDLALVDAMGVVSIIENASQF